MNRRCRSPSAGWPGPAPTSAGRCSAPTRACRWCSSTTRSSTSCRSTTIGEVHLHRQPARPAGTAHPLQRPRFGRRRRLRHGPSRPGRVRLRPRPAGRRARGGRSARAVAVGPADPPAVPVRSTAGATPRSASWARTSTPRTSSRSSIGDPAIEPRLRSFMLSLVDDERGLPRPAVAIELDDLDGVDDAWRTAAARRLPRRPRGPQHRLPLVARRIPRGDAAHRVHLRRGRRAVRRRRDPDQATADREGLKADGSPKGAGWPPGP